MSNKIQTAARILLGIVLLVFGLNGFLQFLPAPELPEAAMSFFGALMATGYLLPLVKAIEVIVGVMLLANRFTPLALVLLAPISVNIVAFHLFLAPAGIGPAALVAVLNLYLLIANRDVFKSILATQRLSPAVA